ncbi:hypothetical protein J7T55_009453 [Diaporthe amygdali]|uniref:uncharacterized protein n=1 Tax=Phomopsis amygdali TaxID=1214568 RepID=UPI0022FE97B7|nr:uncharacterized protein J7T55_009453 [Diaporthe amygdali]KAJ0104289.1 hypothetical protein J7T55_009453 [Diaporthe amygdali]
MSPTMAMTMPAAIYAPTSDVMDRHEYGITKSRKSSSTGGGRAWSEDEEVYLLQTRLQKMPYKHIAAHLKKTELACRLHYHQLSHGSNRRKRTTSMSSSSSSNGHSPLMQATIPSPIHESPSRSVSPPGSVISYGHPSSPGSVQLPSIMNASVGSGSSPRLPAILPKPAGMTLALSTSRYNSLQEHSQQQQHSAPLLPSASFSAAAHARAPTPTMGSATMAPLRLDCSGLPAPSPSAGVAQPVDMGRLQAVYSAHRNSFWSAVAADYGNGAHPVALEQAWRTGNAGTTAGAVSSHGYAAQTPITPIGSPDERDVYGKHSQDKTRISAILGIDANPRSPKEREMVRRMEEERVMVGVGA